MRLPRRRRLLFPVAVLAIVAVALLSGARGSHPAAAGCAPAAAPPPGPLPVQTLTAELEGVPCPDQGQAVYDLRDDRGAPMDVLDPVRDPAGGYLGAYHVLIGRSATQGPEYQMLLAHSTDLLHWRRVALLDSSGATMPALRVLRDGGFLLAYEKNLTGQSLHFVRVRHYAGRAELLSGRFDAQVDLPRRFSRFNNGTPWFQRVEWHGSPARSRITIGFHYESAAGPGPGPDREAVGLLSGFRRWRARRDGSTDAQLDRTGLTGSHGDARQFACAGGACRVYEANTTAAGPDGWHIVLIPPGGGAAHVLRLRTDAGEFSTSFGNPVVEVLPNPAGGGQVLAVSMFVFSSGGAAQEAGELLFLQPD